MWLNHLNGQNFFLEWYASDFAISNCRQANPRNVDVDLTLVFDISESGGVALSIHGEVVDYHLLCVEFVVVFHLIFVKPTMLFWRYVAIAAGELELNKAGSGIGKFCSEESTIEYAEPKFVRHFYHVMTVEFIVVRVLVRID